MGRRSNRDSRPPAQPPGILVHVGETRVEAMQVQCIRYDDDTVTEFTTADIDDCLSEIRKAGNHRLWLRVTGLHEVGKIGTLLNAIGVHPLVQEDILNTNHRPKIEDHAEHLFLTLKTFVAGGSDAESIASEQLSILLADGLVVTFQESESPLFDPLLHRLEHGSGRLRRNGCDYLVWALLDSVIDHYLLCLSAVETEVEAIDSQLMGDPARFNIRNIHTLKAQALQMQRLMRPSRELVGHLERGESPLISEDNRIYFRDLYDHALRCVEDIDVLRESINGLRDYYLSEVSNRMNEVMKVLTCISTIFLPLTFLAGIYGMNFEWMPELGWKAGYPMLWLVFIAAAGTMFWLFKKKRWL